jgi:hypothetical protein
VASASSARLGDVRAEEPLSGGCGGLGGRPPPTRGPDMTFQGEEAVGTGSGANIPWAPRKESSKAATVVSSRSYLPAVLTPVPSNWTGLSQRERTSAAVSAVNTEAVGGPEGSLSLMVTSASRGAQTAQSVRAAHWFWQ